MLCSSKTSHRPDKLLQKRLVSLAYALIGLTAALILLLVYPQYSLYFTILLLLIGALCLSLTIKTISAGEEAMSYGGFANEIIRKDEVAKRIENVLGEAVIENERSKELFKNQTVISFLAEHLSDGKMNKAAIYRLQNACENLISEKVVLSLRTHPEDAKIFTEEEWLEISVHPIYLKKTDIFESKYSVKTIKKDTYLFWSCRDITSEKNMAQIFHEERKSLHDFLDFMPVGLYVVDKEYTIRYCNHALAQILGSNREDLLGRKLSELLSPASVFPENEPSWRQKTYFMQPGGKIIETYVFQENFRENQQIMMRGVIISDLPNDTDLKNELNLACDKVSWLFDHAPVGIIFVSARGIVQAANNTVCRFLNKGSDQLQNQSIFERIREEDAPKVQKAFNDICSGKKDSLCIEVHINLDNKDKIVMLYISKMSKYHSSASSNEEGLILYFIDATEQKSLEQQFAQAQKMQAVGQLAGGVAHDFNNLLTAMIGFCDLVMQRHGIGDPSFEDLRQIKDNATRAAGLVRQLLAFSRKQPLKPKLIDITEHLTRSSQMVKPVLGEQISLKFYHGNNLGFVRVDPTQFSQVIINLAINARDAMNGHGTIFINTRVEHLTEPHQFGDEMVKPGEFVVIDVQDTGCGISPENMNRIFDPFFSTKQNVVGSGTGLGLATVYGIVRQTEGFIKVESTVGEGTTFSIYLPRFEKDTENEEDEKPNRKSPAQVSPILTVKETIKNPININEKMIFGLNVSMIDRSFNPTDPQNSSLRILFVEDEDSVRTFAVRALKKKGYDIISCNSSENALEYLETDSKFDLLLTDMMLPGISGAELAKIVKEKIPGIKIIIASGYSEEMAKQGLDDSTDFEFIAKPYSLGNLTKKVFDVLNKQ